MTKQELIKRINEEGYGYSDDPNDSVLADFVLKIVKEETEKINNLKKKYRKKAKRFKRKYLELLHKDDSFRFDGHIIRNEDDMNRVAAEYFRLYKNRKNEPYLY